MNHKPTAQHLEFFVINDITGNTLAGFMHNWDAFAFRDACEKASKSTSQRYEVIDSEGNGVLRQN